MKSSLFRYKLIFLFMLLIPAYSYEQNAKEVIEAIVKAVDNLKNHSRFRIKNITIRNLPTHKPDGFSWDPLNGAPDVYYTIKYVKDPQAIFTSSVALNLNPLANVNYSLGEQYPQINPLPEDVFTFNSLDKMLIISFWDKDSQGLNISQDDFMGLLVFNPKMYTYEPNKYPGLVILRDGDLAIRIELEWL